MSRIGLKPITVPAGVEIKLDKNNFCEVKGPKGTLTQQFSPDMKIEISEGIATVARPTEQKKHKSLHGLTRTLLSNMITGVTEGYKETGSCRSRLQSCKAENSLNLSLGFSHPVEMMNRRNRD